MRLDFFSHRGTEAQRLARSVAFLKVFIIAPLRNLCASVALCENNRGEGL